MSAEIAGDAPLDYVTFKILQENRYNAFLYSNGNEEMVEHSLLDQLLDHLPTVKDQLANDCCDDIKLKLPDKAFERAWFTKATLKRFLHMVGSVELKKCIAISNEIFQLEETRKFHLSLYAKVEDEIASSDNSKNELLRAMDSRISALMEELVSAFNSVAGGTFSSQEMADLQEFCQQFADVYFSNLLSKLSGTNRKGQIAAPSENKKSPIPFISKKDYINKTDGNIQISGSSNLVEDVKCIASPAKVVEIERQSSTESEDLSFSSEDEQPSVERSRTFIRSASPRRSASPMRRIQVGRSGPRRTPALTIKSLTCFPARERISSHREMVNDCKSEGSEDPDKKTEVNVMRISVQDAISLFESKQRDKTVDNQNRRSFTDTSTNMKKSVLRRWSSGMGESEKSVTQSVSEKTASEDDSELVKEDAQKSEEQKPDKGSPHENPVLETVEVDLNPEMNEKISNLNQDNVPSSGTELANEILDSAEWGKQKEDELIQMQMKFAEYNQTTSLKKAEPDNSNKGNSSLEGRSGAYDHYKERKDEKLTGGNAGKKVEKLSEYRAKKNVQENLKAERISMKVYDGGKRQTMSKMQNGKNKEPEALNSKKESLKSVEPKKTSLKKSSPLPATRKSWPPTPSLRATGTLPVKKPAGAMSSETNKTPPQKSQSPAPRQKPQLPGPQLRPSPRAERSPIDHKDVKTLKFDAKKSLKKVEDVKNQVAPKIGKSTKTNTSMAPKAQTKNGKTTRIRTLSPEEKAGTSPAKAVVRKRVNKKSSIVPLEAKPSSCNISDKVHLAEGDATIQKEETPNQVEEILSKCEDPIPSIIQENDGDTISSNTVQLVEGDPVLETHNDHVELEKEIDKEKPNYGVEKVISDEVPDEGDEVTEKMPGSPKEICLVHEPLISPAAWEESTLQDPCVPSINSSNQSPAHHDIAASSEAKVRHSLSQMLLEEISEPVVHQKDAPKGLKRLLKFARKNKGEPNGAAWASPYTSEGEDDGDEDRNHGKRNSDNLLRKVTLHSKNYAEGVLSDSEPISARSSISNSSTRSSSKFQEGHGTTKGARSFFSLSAFRGNKS